MSSTIFWHGSRRNKRPKSNANRLPYCRTEPVIFNVWSIWGLNRASYVSKILKISLIVASSSLKAFDFFSKLCKQLTFVMMLIFFLRLIHCHDINVSQTEIHSSLENLTWSVQELIRWNISGAFVIVFNFKLKYLTSGKITTYRYISGTLII